MPTTKLTEEELLSYFSSEEKKTINRILIIGECTITKAVEFFMKPQCGFDRVSLHTLLRVGKHEQARKFLQKTTKYDIESS